MKKEYEDHYHVIEANHWWFRSRRQIVRELVLRTQPDRLGRILEIGCSGGLLIDQLNRDGYDRITGIDISAEAIELCKRHGLQDVHVMDAQRLSFPDERYDVITASDVLEHLPEEDKAVLEWQRMLKPGGALIVFVPAFQALWTVHDEINKHLRRYRRSSLLELLVRNGFKVERSSYWNSFLFPPIFLFRVLKRFLPRSERELREGDFFSIPAWINETIAKLMQLENSLISKGLSFPFGVSVMAIARKPGRA